MKKINYILCSAVLLAGGVLTSCYDMDLEAKDVMGENILFSNDAGVQKYLARIYNEAPIEDFNFDLNGDHPGFGFQAGSYHAGNDYWSSFKGCLASAALEVYGRGTANDLGRNNDYWPYDRIREINTLIQNLPEYEANWSPSEYEAVVGEARFLRALYYFALVKRYGGVPLISEPQNPADDLETLQVPRATEYDSWKFIYEDLKYAMEHAHADMKNAAATSRGNRYAAAALMSKAMLHAACVAKYGGYTGITGPAVTAGLQGMSADKATEFFQYAYDAAKFVKESGLFRLHDGSDKVSAYTEVFIADCADEDIFVKHYGDGVANRPLYDKDALLHCYDAAVLPLGTGLSQAVGSGIHPVWEQISLYQMPAIEDADGKPVRFDDLSDIWNNDEMEARCKANFFFSGMTDPVSGEVLDTQSGIYITYPGTTADGCQDVGKQGSDYNNNNGIKFLDKMSEGTDADVPGYGKIKVRGKYGYTTGDGDEGRTVTGLYIRKYVNTNASANTRTLFGSSTPWKEFRYGHVLCDLAEAAYELGLATGNDNLKREAFDVVNEIRDRAGARRHDMVAAPADLGTELYGFEVDENLQYIRDERARELFMENQRYWDLRRWRIADVMFQNYLPHAFHGYYVASEGKYIYLPQYEEDQTRHMTFDKKAYYSQIPGGEINKNPNLIRNDGY